MYQNSIALIRGSIFPIFFQIIQGANRTVGVSGTGFFIDNQGHFITANHVITDIPAGAQILYAGNVPINIQPQPSGIHHIVSDPVRDIYIGRINQNALPPVTLFHQPTPVGTSICLCGYPLAQMSFDPNGALNVSNVRQYWQPTFAIDGAHINAHGRIYDGFITQDTSLRGMSGGPVFDVSGRVHGIDVATWTRNIPQQNGPDMIVNNGVVVGFHSIQDLLQQLLNNQVQPNA
jgi:trypsin-like peptidase